MAMKKSYKYIALIIVFFLSTYGVRAQEMNTLYFMENAPMRHTINPALQPVGNFYLLLPVIGYTDFMVGNNAVCMKDLIFIDKISGKTITALHPNAGNELWKKLPNNVNISTDLYINLLSFGFRTQHNGFFHFNFSERMNIGIGLPKSSFGPLLGQGMDNINLRSTHASASLYSEFSFGYTRPINNQWVVGGKLKVLMGHAFMRAKFSELEFTSTQEMARLYGHGSMQLAGVLNAKNIEGLISNGEIPSTNISELITPSGFGGALDMGVTYKPFNMLQVSASITDLGLIHWAKGDRATISMDTTFNGFTNSNYQDYIDENGNVQTDVLTENLSGYLDAIHFQEPVTMSFNQMITANLNIGVDANFWKNRVGVGIYSRTRFYNDRVSEEITIGAAFRPMNWFNLAASYSIINGYGGNVGAALSIAPYDGLMLTVAADYIPTSYAPYQTEKQVIPLPYQTGCVNLSFGIAIVAGTCSKRHAMDDDKDGVADDFDMCLQTPVEARVDMIGCPVDADGDGVPDYIDQCPNTPSEAYGLIDSVGCPIDSDGDAVPDYIDQCPNTIEEARNYVNETGCVLDTDGDGVVDYLDQCPGTPAAAYEHINEHGCPLDSDGDGVADYMDQCPETPAEAAGKVDQYGCPQDSDRDGVLDYMDRCLNTPAVARNHVDEYGCPLDSDHDGVYDFEDVCPTVLGSKSNSGCPEISREVQILLNKAKVEILFENGKPTLKESSRNILKRLARAFADNPSYQIEIQGHTDNVGNYQYNKELSERRAHAVREYLIDQGVPAQMLTAHGYASDRPIATNDTKEGRTQNNRIEFNVTFE